jgi:hypothetical protein
LVEIELWERVRVGPWEAVAMFNLLSDGFFMDVW